MIVVFDTETTGKADFRSDFTADHQPHMIQIGALLLDGGHRIRAELNLIVKPNGFTIPPEASMIHGITDKVAFEFGFELADVLRLFGEMVLRAHIIVAHNFAFDRLIVSSAYHRAGEDGNRWLHQDQIQVCTMKHMTPICNLPGPYGPKWPSLQEAHRHCFGSDFDGAHDAMADVRACARIYRWWTESIKPLMK